MKTEWTTTRPNGKPIEPGTFCRVLDMEDGTNPLYFYGKTEQEVYDKIAMNSLHARRALDRRDDAAATAPQGIPVTSRKRMTADETMQATADLQNPAKAGDAAARLMQDATGVDLKKMAMDAFKLRAEEWMQEHPEFYGCKPNKTLLATRLGQIVNGDVALITKEMMTQCYTQMIAAGDLIDHPDDTQNASQLPEEKRVQRVETIPSGRNGTGVRSTSFRAGHVTQTKTLKYTKEQIDRMNLAKTEALIRSGDKDYAEACEFYYPSAVKATA